MEVAEFLRSHPQFDAATDAELAAVAAAAEVETCPAGATIFTRCAEPVTLWVPRTVAQPLTRAFRESGPTSQAPSTVRAA